jgi:predicted nucleic acid-binding protein
LGGRASLASQLNWVSGMISMTGRVFIDTNILIYALDPADPAKRQVSADLLRQTISGRTLTLSPQSLSETYRVLTQRRRLMPVETARAYIRTLAPWAIAPLDAKTVERAFAVEDETGYSWLDSLMLAAALQANCRLFVSEDLQDGRDVAGMRIADPFAAGFAPTAKAARK